MQVARLHATAFVLAIAVVLVAPLPLGANRPLFWAVNGAVIGLSLALSGVAQLFSQKAPKKLSAPLRIAGAIFLSLLAWIAVQMAPFVPRAWQHPYWDDARVLVGAPIQGAISVYPTGTLDAALRWLSTGSLFVVFLATGQDRRRREVALFAIAAATTLYAFGSLIVHLNAPLLITGIRKWAYFDFVTGPFVNPNHFATYLGIGSMVLLALILSRIDLLQRRTAARFRVGMASLSAVLDAQVFVLVCMAAVAILALLATGSRAGIASTAVGAIVLLVTFSLRSRERSGLASVIAAALLGALVLALLGFLAGVMTGGSGQAASDVENRLRLFRDTLSAIGARPWTGHGAGAFSDAFASFVGVDIHVGRTYREAHNTYLEIAASFGIPAALAALVMFACLMIPVVKANFQRGRPYAAPLAATGAIVVVGIHALFDFSIQIQAVTLTFFTLIAIAHAQAMSQQSQREKKAQREADLGQPGLSVRDVIIRGPAPFPRSEAGGDEATSDKGDWPTNGG
ncbi:hypothetical protein GR183_20125 [Stappia sp. GBMRC 2046]|uniref:O-antigen ligase-related domain-containing protein n=1 Tax=Stappia sediminis TaxID=2692190 RepID=A0A7X3LY84_9HYPH|nr:O-antigen ligase family protein [Stappia sediminis]MXN67221.1 hypothetical protein [Stappia sediminis]